MSTIDTKQAGREFNRRLGRSFSKIQNTTSGFVTSVDNDTSGRPQIAHVQIGGGVTVSSLVPYGTNVYPGVSVTMVNDGSPSLASWRISGSLSSSPVHSGGRIVNQSGSVISNFSIINVDNGGYIKAGSNALGEGPNLVIDELGLYVYDDARENSYIVLASVDAYGRRAADVFLGSLDTGKANFLVSPAVGSITMGIGTNPFLTISGDTGNRLEDYLWIGPSTGPQIGLGSMLGVAEMAMRDTQNRYVWLVRSDPMRVQIGATGDTEYILWENGQLIVNGVILASRIDAQVGTIGGFTVSSDGFEAQDGSTFFLSSGGITLDAIASKFNGSSLNWKTDGTEYLGIGTIVDLGSVTGAALRSYTDLWIGGSNDVYISPGSGGHVFIGGSTSFGETMSNYVSIDENGVISFVGSAGISGYLKSDGTVTGASSQAQTFTNGIVGPSWKPSSNSTTALQLQNATGVAIVNVDTSNARVGINTAAPSSQLHVTLSDAETVAVSNLLTISHNSSGTPGTLFGSRLTWELETTTTENQAAAYLEVLWADATHVSRTAAARLSTVKDGVLVDVAKFGGTLGNVFNEEGTAWCDFRVEGDTSTHLVFVDASVDSVGIGTSAPSSRLHVLQTSGDTNARRDLLTITHNSTGTPATNFGAGIAFQLESNTTESQLASAIEASWITSTHASRAGRVSLLGSYTGTLYEGVRVEGTSSGQQTRIGDPSGAANYTQFDSTGHITFAGSAKPWQDMLIEPVARTTGANAPTFEKWFDDAGGTSRGVYLYSFDDSASEKEMFFNLQMSHAWDGGNIQFHVHWVPAVSQAAIDDTEIAPRWGLEYCWKEPGGVFGDTAIAYAATKAPADVNVVAGTHYITAFTALSPGSTADDLSSVLIGRLFRNSSDAADTYNTSGAKCGLLYIDAHYQLGRIGSNDEYIA